MDLNLNLIFTAVIAIATMGTAYFKYKKTKLEKEKIETNKEAQEIRQDYYSKPFTAITNIQYTKYIAHQIKSVHQGAFYLAREESQLNDF